MHERHRLFAHHVQPSIQRGHGHRVVQVIGRSDDQRVQAAFGDHLPIVGENGCDLVLGRHLLGALAVAAADGDELCAWMALRLGMYRIRTADCADDTDSNLIDMFGLLSSFGSQGTTRPILWGAVSPPGKGRRAVYLARIFPQYLSQAPGACPFPIGRHSYSLCPAKKRAKRSAAPLGFVCVIAWVASGRMSFTACGSQARTVSCTSRIKDTVCAPRRFSTGWGMRAASSPVKDHGSRPACPAHHHRVQVRHPALEPPRRQVPVKHRVIVRAAHPLASLDPARLVAGRVQGADLARLRGKLGRAQTLPRAGPAPAGPACVQPPGHPARPAGGSPRRRIGRQNAPVRCPDAA